MMNLKAYEAYDPLIEFEKLPDETKEFLQRLFLLWGFSGRHLTQIPMQGSELLLKDLHDGILKDGQVLDVAQMVHHGCMKSYNLWRLVEIFAHVYFRPKEMEWKAVYLSDLFKHTHFDFEDNIRVEFPENLPPIKGCCNLSMDIVFFYLTHVGIMTSANIIVHPIVISAKQDGSTVVIQIDTGIESDPSDVEQPLHLFRFFDHGNGLSIADLIVRQHGSQIITYPSGEGTAFQFALPVWDG